MVDSELDGPRFTPGLVNHVIVGKLLPMRVTLWSGKWGTNNYPES